MTNDFFKMTTEEKMATYGWTREQVPIMEAHFRELMKSDPNQNVYHNKWESYLHKNVKITLKNGTIKEVYIDSLAESDDNDVEEEGVLYMQNDCLVEILDHDIESIEIA